MPALTPDEMAVALAVALCVVWAFMLLRVRTRRRTSHGNDTKDPPPEAILVDGSNVLFWGGAPSFDVLKAVIDDLRARGINPVVIFDASVGYKIADRFMGSGVMAASLGLSQAHVRVVDKGVVADQVLLDLAKDHGLRVVSNDRFRDWRAQYPAIARKSATVRGRYRGGAVQWHPAARFR